MAYFVYILRCKDGTLYTGSTNNTERRFALHQKGLGAKYTRAHPPQAIVFTKKYKTKNVALKAEYAIKQRSRSEKLELIQKNQLRLRS